MHGHIGPLGRVSCLKKLMKRRKVRKEVLSDKVIFTGVFIQEWAPLVSLPSSRYFTFLFSHLSFSDRLCKDPFPRGANSNFLQYDWSIVTKDDDY